MPLYLLEYSRPIADQAAGASHIDSVALSVRQSGGDVIEAQVAKDLQRVYLVVEHSAPEAVTAPLDSAGLGPDDIAQVRLVGADLDAVKAARGTAGYLVEWDLPAGLTMDRYLARKASKSPLYANVPEVQFLRTYVREDMMKCLCFYDAPDEDAVRRARQAVEAPIDRLSRLG